MPKSSASRPALCSVLAIAVLAGGGATAQPPAQAGITAATQVARAYDLILDANFDEFNKSLPGICPPAPIVACRGLEALSLWWQIQLDLENRHLDQRFLTTVNAAIAGGAKLICRVPERVGLSALATRAPRQRPS